MTDFLTGCEMWAAVCLMEYVLGEMAGRKMLYALFRGMFGGWTTAIVMGLVVPLLVWNATMLFDHFREGAQMLVLVTSAVLGLLLGSTMENLRTKVIAPPVPMFPLGIAINAGLIGRLDYIRDNRTVFVPAMLFPPAAIRLIFGQFQDATSSYYTRLILLLLAAIVELQTKLRGHLDGVWDEVWQTVVIMATADTAAFWMMAEGK